MSTAGGWASWRAPRESRTDILIVGGGLGGCAAAMAATALGKRVILTEPTDWLGGQLTAQTVPPDEHRHIERLPLSCTFRYHRLRSSIRQYYRDHYPVKRFARANPFLDPGGCWVSYLCCEPRVALAVLEQMMAYARVTGLLDVRFRRAPAAIEMDGDHVRAVTLRHLETGDTEVVQAAYVLDATELGDLLPLAGVEYVTGAESQDETGEPHAVNGPPRPDDVQAFTWCLALSYDPDGDHVIERPAQYEYWSTFVPQLTPPWPGRLLDWTTSDPMTLKPKRWVLFPEDDDDPYRSLWLYRRIVSSSLYDAPVRPCDVTLVNWPQNDYFMGNIIDQPDDVVARHLEAARQLSLSLVYWLQTEAPRPDGGVGYPGLYLRPDIVGTEDGLAKQPYIREARRIRAEFTITEQYVLQTADAAAEPTRAGETVGIGCWHSIDLHPTTGGRNYIDFATPPLRIPLGALIPIRVENLLPACKNIGTTHITNGGYRVHAVEWTIGEIVGLLTAFCLERKCAPRQVRVSESLLAEFQALLRDEGVIQDWRPLP